MNAPLARRIELLETMLEGLLVQRQFAQAFKNVTFFLEHVDAREMGGPELARVMRLAVACRRGLDDGAPELVTSFLNRLGEMVAKLITGLAYTQALPLAEGAVEACAQLDAPGEQYAHLMNLGVLYDSLERFMDAEAAFARGRAASGPSGIAGWFHLRSASTLAKRFLATRDRGLQPQLEQHVVAAERAFAGTTGQGAELTRDIRRTANLIASTVGDPIGSTVGSRVVEQGLVGMAKFRAGELETATAIFAGLVDAGELPDTDPIMITTLNNQGAVYQQRGLFVEALAAYQRALTAARITHANGGPALAVPIANVAIAEKLLGHFAPSETHFREAISLLEVSVARDDLRLAGTIDNFGTLYHVMGDPERAIEWHQVALELYTGRPGAETLESSSTPVHPTDVAICMTNLGNAHQQRGELSIAMLFYRRAAQIVRAVHGERHPIYGTAVSNLATLYAAAGDPVSASRAFEDAVAIARATKGARSADVGTALLGLGRVLAEVGSAAEARAALSEADAILATALGRSHPILASVLEAQARLCIAGGSVEDGLRLLLGAQAIYDGAIGHIFSMSSEPQRAKYIASIQTSAFAVHSVVAEHLAHVPSALGAALDLALRRKAIEAEALVAQRDAVLGGRYPELRTQLAELVATRTQLADATLAGTGDLEVLRRRREDLERQLARLVPELAQAGAGVERHAVAAALPHGSALVEIVRTNRYDLRSMGERGASPIAPLAAMGIALPESAGRVSRGATYLAFILHAGQPDSVTLVELGDAEVVDALVAQTLQQVAADRTRDLALPTPSHVTQSDAAYALTRSVFEPLCPALGACTQVFLSPDGALSQLPIEILPLADGACVIDRYAINYLSAGRDVLRFGRGVVPCNTSLVIADPDYDLGSGSSDVDGDVRFVPLPGARREGDRVAARLGVVPLVGEDALESSVRAASSPRVLHIATHGYFLRELTPGGGSHLARLGAGQRNPLLRCGLALAGANTHLRGGVLPPGAGDAILNGEDVANLDLRGTELVVLSACDTGLGETQVGEGVFGLRRAFVLAGAAGLVMSLWKVADDITADLMDDLYRRVIAGEPRAAALRAAQLAIKARGVSTAAWGAFVYQGEPGAIRGYSATREMDSQ